MKEFFHKIGIIKRFINPKTENNNIEQNKNFIDDIEEIKKRLDAVHQRYNLTSDNDLLDSLIYEEKSLLSRYEYLIKTAKQKGIKNDLQIKV